MKSIGRDVISCDIIHMATLCGTSLRQQEEEARDQKHLTELEHHISEAQRGPVEWSMIKIQVNEHWTNYQHLSMTYEQSDDHL